MKILVIAAAVLIIFPVSICLAGESPVNKAYSLFYSGNQDEAVQIMEEYIIDNPDPAAYYFLGYAYYEMKDLEKSSRYFDEAYRLKSFYSPEPEEGNQ